MRTRTIGLICLALLSTAAAHPAVAIVGPLTREHEVEPGRSYSGSIEVHNSGDAPQAIKIYQTDYFYYASGEVLYGEPGALPRSNGKWIAFTPQEVTIPAGESVTIRYSIQAPADDTMKGTYWSVLMVEPIVEGSPEAVGAQPDKVTMGVRQVVRYGIQIVTHVGATGSRKLKFSQFSLKAENGKRVLVIDLENSGERWLRPNVWAELYDAKGTYVGKFDGGAQRLYPGTSARFKSELVGVQDADYKALVVADCGGDDVFGANINLFLRE